MSPIPGTLISQIPTEIVFAALFDCSFYRHPSFIMCTHTLADNDPQFTEDNGHFINVRAFLVAYKFTISFFLTT